MLNGKDLAGWNTALTRDAKFELTTNSSGPLPQQQPSGPLSSVERAGERGGQGSRAPSPELQVTNGPGQLETDASYGDFVMQLECLRRRRRPQLRRLLPLHPRATSPTATSARSTTASRTATPPNPLDAGTGAIYRRITARRVVSKDHEWFTMTIVADRPAHRRLGQRLPSHRLDRRPPARRQPPQRPPPRPRHHQPPSPRPDHQPPLPQPEHRGTPSVTQDKPEQTG